MTTSRPLARLAAAAILLAPVVAQAAEALNLDFGVYTSDKPSVMYAKFKPTLAYLEKQLGNELNRRVKIKLRIFKSYDEANERLVEGKVDFVRFGPASYVIAKQRNPQIELLAIEEVDGQRSFKGVILAHADSSINSLQDLRGKSFAFGDEYSTIGRYLSQAELVKEGVHASDLWKFEYLGRHDLVVTAVLHGKFDAGAAKEDTFRKFADKGLKAVKTFDNVTKPWVARAGLGATVTSALTEGLVGLKDPRVLKKIGGVSGFGRVSDKEYDSVRVAMEVAKRFSTAGRTPAAPGSAPEHVPASPQE